MTKLNVFSFLLFGKRSIIARKSTRNYNETRKVLFIAVHKQTENHSQPTKYVETTISNYAEPHNEIF